MGLLGAWPRMFSLRTEVLSSNLKGIKKQACGSWGKNILERRNSKGPKVRTGLGGARGLLRLEQRGVRAELWGKEL